MKSEICMDHHLLREQHQRDFCPYCRTQVNGDKWKSEWHNNTHYKTLDCRGCTRIIWMPVDFDGDGTDNWDGNGLVLKRVGNLEMKLLNSG